MQEYWRKDGAAKIILDKELNAVSLEKQIESIISNRNKNIEMGNNANKIAINNVEEKIYEEIVKILQ